MDEWDAVLPLAKYTINHRTRDILGGRNAVEVMTARAPRTAYRRRPGVTRWRQPEELCELTYAEHSG